jgi:Flp pilus assembly protein TadG
MIVCHQPRTAARRGATTVEVAVVLSAFLLLMFAIFEYGRYVMVHNVVVNASREGCRYAVVHAQDATVVNDVRTRVRARMGGVDSQLPDLAINVFPTNNPTAALNTTVPDEPITVQVSGTFTSIFANLPFLHRTLTVRSSTIMTCEGN